MGCWGIEPYDNDAAADWFGYFFEKNNFLPYIENALNQNPEEYFEEIRAAAYIVLQLGHTYVWPVGEIDKFNKLAAEKLEAVKKVDVILESEEIVEEIEKEIAILKSRISS